ncbi:putative monovalent cation/H+ antiporter subunit C [Corynebacterium efficiens YS-314]|uniref:Na(+)/H(+) antiporter subunit C n=1 Tax=Corynebacterium efficiens (strain DSM 44549 / YS-314 / AJ 12310 / JCM 11189 / NBRC 100395) TaxID=196164 RepID=Q8FTZ5_COREF|nr:cation:proton antiporter subunit C [Corynebacterium efficiens]EEW48856.1 putative monovalent cation/H+ antiporter subunit C [Corynebacterium efficiens YS-314]BAC17037.1 hypothetical protein [Corynebacterium efficiens YS-314]
MTIAISAGLLMTAAVYLMLRRDMLRVTLGFVFLGHTSVIILMASGGVFRRDEPFGSGSTTAADPLPQAFVLTAIVIAFSITVFMLVLTVTGRRDDAVESSKDIRSNPELFEEGQEIPAGQLDMVRASRAEHRHRPPTEDERTVGFVDKEGE